MKYEVSKIRYDPIYHITGTGSSPISMLPFIGENFGGQAFRQKNHISAVLSTEICFIFLHKFDIPDILYML